MKRLYATVGIPRLETSILPRRQAEFPSPSKLVECCKRIYLEEWQGVEVMSG